MRKSIFKYPIEEFRVNMEDFPLGTLIYWSEQRTVTKSSSGVPNMFMD